MKINSMLLTDWYKVGHPNQYHSNTTLVYSNLTARKSRLNGIDKAVIFGIQGFIKEYLIDHFRDNFFGRPEEEVIQEYSRRIRTSLGSDLKPLEVKFYKDNYPSDPYGHIRHLHRTGYLPIEIKALPEGSKVPMRVPFVTIKNTKSEFFWLTNFIETIMSASTWQSITSATISDDYRKIFDKYAEETVGDKSFVQFQGHDFSFRGMSSLQSAYYSGAAHLLSFVGSDTIPAIDYLEMYYSANADKELIGCSVAATEHAVMCSNTGFYIYDKADGDWSKIGECELSVFKRLITEIYPDGIVSIVSDTWDLWRVLTEYVPILKEEILSRNGKVVFRPDSGDPADIICGIGSSPKVVDKNGEIFNYHETSSHFRNTCSLSQYKGVIELLWDVFGGTITSEGYKLLDSHVGAIYGDSVTRERAVDICERLKKKGFASINLVYGIGSFTFQFVTRDSLGLAVKATYCEAISSDGSRVLEIPIFKDPITDDGTKKSAKGLLRVDEIYESDATGKLSFNTYKLTDQCTKEQEAGGALQTVFIDGKLVKEYSLSEIRERLSK